MDESQLRLPSQAEYEAAFTAIEPKITAKQREMLVFHHAQPGRAVSARTLAAAVGWDTHTSANLQYGSLAHALNNHLGADYAKTTKVGTLVDFVFPGQADNTYFLWIMREPVARALEALGWVPAVADHLYPHLALGGASAVPPPPLDAM